LHYNLTPGASRTPHPASCDTARPITTDSGCSHRRFNCPTPECPSRVYSFFPSRPFHPLFSAPISSFFACQTMLLVAEPRPSTQQREEHVLRAGLIVAMVFIAQSQPQPQTLALLSSALLISICLFSFRVPLVPRAAVKHHHPSSWTLAAGSVPLVVEPFGSCHANHWYKTTRAPFTQQKILFDSSFKRQLHPSFRRYCCWPISRCHPASA
jgi:hypothetical protein